MAGFNLDIETEAYEALCEFPMITTKSYTNLKFQVEGCSNQMKNCRCNERLILQIISIIFGGLSMLFLFIDWNSEESLILFNFTFSISLYNIFI